MTSRNLRSATRFLFASSAAVLSIALPAQAAPSWSDITQQAGTFTKDVNVSTNTVTINQTSSRAVGYANNLSIRSGDTVNIVQGASGDLFVAKANARDGLPSAILGKLNANGNVMILDGNGVLFGKDAQINVGGIVASTGDVRNSECNGFKQIKI
jgi:filamentous hemagglutinin family protein